MQLHNHYISSITQSALLCGLRRILTRCAWTPLIGSCNMYLGLGHAIMPVAYAYSGIYTIMMSLLFHAGYIWTVSASWLGLLRNLPLPTCIASAYLLAMQTCSQRNRIIISSILSLCGWTCFMVHPVEYDALLYTSYWIIPIIAAVYANRSPVMIMLGATFAAHIAGSCLWLYTIELSSHQWNALIPVVALERLTNAGIMTVTYYACTYITLYYQSACAMLRRAGQRIYAII